MRLFLAWLQVTLTAFFVTAQVASAENAAAAAAAAADEGRGNTSDGNPPSTAAVDPCLTDVYFPLLATVIPQWLENLATAYGRDASTTRDHQVHYFRSIVVEWHDFFRHLCPPFATLILSFPCAPVSHVFSNVNPSTPFRS